MREPTIGEVKFRECFDAWSKHFEAPLPGEYLLFNAPTPDRCFFSLSRRFLLWYDSNVRSDFGVLRRWRLGIGNHSYLGKKTARTGARDLRLFYSVQLILHERGVDRRGWKERLQEWIEVDVRPPGEWIVEADVDAFNPAIRGGAAMPVLHLFGDYIWHRAKMLAGQPKGMVSPFEVEKVFVRDGIISKGV